MLSQDYRDDTCETLARMSCESPLLNSQSSREKFRRMSSRIPGSRDMHNYICDMLQNLANAILIYGDLFSCKKLREIIDIFNNYTQNIQRGYSLEPPRNLQSLLWIKNKKNRIPLYTIVYFITMGFKGVYISWIR